MSRLRLAAVVAALAMSTLLALSAAPAFSAPRAVLAFLPAADNAPSTVPGGVPQARRKILDILDAHPEMSLGLSSAAQGRYFATQALLDITQGSRTSSAAYDPTRPASVDFLRAVDGARMFGWPDAVKRADSAPAEVVPGLLASSIPGGVGYVGVEGREQREALAATDKDGRIAEARITLADDEADAVKDMLTRHRLVVVGLASEETGDRTLRKLIQDRDPDTLLIVQKTAPLTGAPQLLPTGVVGLGGQARALTSSTTHQHGLIAGIDLPVTILDHLGLPIPDQMKGQVIAADGPRSAPDLQSLEARLKVIAPRRFPALEVMLAAWVALTLLLGLVADRRGLRAAQRIGALSFCWLLPVLLVTGWLAPSRTAELAIIVAGTFLLAALTDLLLSWPRAIALPAGVAVVSYVLDLARGSDLIIRSLLGPNPRFGSRFYGIGNELEASLPVLLFIAIAGVLYGRQRSRGTVLAFGIPGVLLTGAVASGRMGADVGGVFTIVAGTAVCVLLMLPGGVTRRALGLAVVSPAIGLVGLAVLDLTTGGDSHFTRTILHADSSGALWDTFSRRIELAFRVFSRGLMPFATIIAALAVAYGVKHRARIYAVIGDDPAWRAALWGGLASGIAGTIFNDSGPMLLLFSVFVLLMASSYLRGGDNPTVSEKDAG